MDAVTLHDAAHTSVQSDPKGTPATSERRVRVGITPTELIIDDGDTAQRFEFETRRRTVLRHATRSARESSLLAYVHERVLPKVLNTDNHFPIQHRIGRYELESIEAGNDPKAAAKQIAGLQKLRRKAGRYAYALDVLIGEKQVERGEQELASKAFAAALACDSELAATWVSLGRTYARQLRYADAWDCFDDADALCPQHEVVGDIHQLDAQLRAHYGALF